MPAATSTELGTFLGVVDIDRNRAGLLLDLARDLIVLETGLPASVWPDALRTVHLTAAARAFTNPAAKTTDAIMARSFTVRDVGIYLTDAERATCALAGGRSGLRSVPLVVPGEVYPRVTT